MDMKTLTNDELNSLLGKVQAEIETRRACAAAPALIQQTAIKALANGVTAADLRQALSEVLELPTDPEPPVVDTPEVPEDIPVEPIETEESPAEPVNPVESEEPVVAPDTETPGETS